MIIKRTLDLQRCGIYKIINKSNNNCYIGSSVNIYNRLLKHRSQLRHNNHYNKYLQNAWNKYGEDDFVFEILEYCDTNDQYIKEQFYINNFNPEYNQDKNIFPIIMSEEKKTKISKTLKNKHNNKEIDIINRRKINVFDLEGNLIFTFNSLKDTCQNLNIGYSSLYRCLIGKHKKIRQYQFRYENSNISINKIETYNSLITKRKPTKGYSIKVININTNEELNFISMVEASKYFNMTSSQSVKQILVSKNKLYKKQWLFKFL